MSTSTSLSEFGPAHRATIVAAIAFAIAGALAPIGVALYEHRFHLLPIRTIEILWPSSIVLFPDPTSRFPILMNSLSIGLNALIYGVTGLILGGLIDVLRGGASSARPR